MKNNDLRVEQKKKALEIMKKLNIFKDFSDAFDKKDWITVYENGIGYWTWQYDDITAKIKDIESRNGCLVYAITHEYTDFGECYSMLVIPREKTDWKELVFETDTNSKKWYAFAYVWNATDDWLSEFGDIVVKNQFGGLVRIG